MSREAGDHVDAANPSAEGAAGTAFGTTCDGEPVRLFTLEDDCGMSVRISDLGATLVGVSTPDRDGRMADVVLGFDDATGYCSNRNHYHGATIGRVANRIANASFELDGAHYRLVANEAPHHLHGGLRRSFDKVRWSLVEAVGNVVELRYTSRHEEEGYPGTLEARAVYRLADGALTVEYRAWCDRRTPVNMTNHAYFNLAGAGLGTVLDHEVQMDAGGYTPTTEEMIPTGEVRDVAGTPLDLRSPQPVGARIDELAKTPALGYDHNFVLDGASGVVRPVARVRDPSTGRVLELQTEQPALQLYSGNRLTGAKGRHGRRYERFGGLCLEPQHYPDALHHSSFPSIVVEPGEVYRHRSVYRFTTDTGD